MAKSVFTDNGFFESLPLTAFELLSPNLSHVSYAQGAILQEANDPIDRVYFPHSGMISFLTMMRNGDGSETASVGKEGAINFAAGFGSQRSPCRAVMSVSGAVSQISAANFRAAVESSADLRNHAVVYNDIQLATVHQTGGCNALHRIEQRMCRLLLQTRDRCESDTIPLTQEFLSQILGVQRTSITEIARTLQNAGLIKYRRGVIEIVDHAGLKEKACECYEILRDNYNISNRRE